MIPAPLAGLRIGSVPYLNAKPLVWGLQGHDLTLEVPAVLSRSFEAGKLDAALLPLFEVLRLGGGTIADDIAIACLGEVFSVFVASREDFPAISEIALDPSSRSSVALLKVLLAEFYPGGPRVVESSPATQGARLLIGDPALSFRQEHEGEWRFHDLGTLWQQHTGLPFVFAAWALHPALVNQASVAEALRSLKSEGLLARSAIAGAEPAPASSLHYLTESIRYDLKEDEKKAIELFSHLAHKHGLLPSEVKLSYC